MPDNNINKKWPTKAGECLKSGLGLESSDDMLDMNLSHLSAFVAYTAMVGILGREHAKKVRNTLRWMKSGVENLMVDREKDLMSSLIKGLKEKINVKTSRDLFIKLDYCTIPDWVFEQRERIIELIPDIYFVENRIYVFLNLGESYYFRCLIPEEIKNIYSAFDISRQSSNRNVIGTISKMYSKLIGFDSSEKIFYLKVKGMDMLYATYHVKKRQEVFHHRKLLGLYHDKFPITEFEGALWMNVAGEERLIKETDPSEKYEVLSNCIKVTPSADARKYFKEYVLLFDGTRHEYDYRVIAMFMLHEIGDELKDQEEGDDSFLGGAALCMRYLDNEDEALTLKLFNEMLHDFDPIDNIKILWYKKLLQFMTDYLPDDEDILDHLYMFADVSRRISDGSEAGIIIEKLVSKLFKLEDENRLRGIIGNCEALRKALLTGYDTDEDTLPAKEKTVTSDCCKIGCFDMEGKNTVIVAEDIKRAVLVGDNLMVKDERLPGVVSYNIVTGVYEVGYIRSLEEWEQEEIVNELGLQNKACRFYVDHHDP